MKEPHAKRLKITRGEDDYLPGNIIEIELHNFMTFDSLVCRPGSRLNLVIGPNGSGKSSLVCAIALCLGGEPQLLGRATSVAAYVKRGEDSGYIKISLRGETDEEQIVIGRKIDTRNKSEWLLDGRAVAKREVLEIIQKFNIQVNNLTQFLPQDRVCEFAKLTPVQLLEETEKAVGDPQLPVQRRALVEKSRELKQLEQAVERNGETLNQLKALNAEQERDVERVRQREELLEKVESMKKKLPWLKYDMKKAEYMKTKDQMKVAKKKFEEAAKTLKDVTAPIEKQKQEKGRLETKRKKINNLMSENSKKRMELLEKENQAEMQVRAKYKEMEEIRAHEELRQQKILDAKEDLAKVEQELQNLPVYEPPKADLEKLSSKILELEVQLNKTKSRKSEKDRELAQKKQSLRQCTDRLTDMENANNKLLSALRNSGAEKIFEAYRWLQSHRHEMNKEVYGPVLLEVNVLNKVHANYLEGHIAFYIWKSFITQDPGDRDFLVKNLKPFDVPVLNYSPDYPHQEEPFQISREIHELGINSRLDQTFDAPEAVKEVLTSQFGLDRSYIGSKETDQRADEVAKLGIYDFWTPDNHYRWSTSRYGSHVSGSVEPVHASNLLLCGSDAGEIEKLRTRKKELEESVSEIEEKLKALETERRLLENNASEEHKKREDIIEIVQREKIKRRNLGNLIIQRKKKLESLEKENDVDSEVAKRIDQAVRCQFNRHEYALKMKVLLVEAVSYKWNFTEVSMSFVEMDAKIRESEINIKQHEKSAQNASLQLEYCKKEVEDMQQQLLAAKRHAESVCIITPEVEKEFLEMPTTIEELDAAIQDSIAHANSFYFLNQNILQEYEHRRRQIETIAAKLESDRNKLRSCLEDIEALKNSWLPTLRRLVAQINETFGRNFQEMAVAGEVQLDEHDKDFDQFGILIKVKFRESGQLKVLSAHHQSGGERSVSTILYLVSLQDLTNCPFRVVDEINQGMDPINERKMFQQLVRAASQPNTPQCFLLTPKLLPDLQYSEACSILNIMNGPWIEQPSKVWSRGECWGTVMGIAGTN